MAKKKPEDKVKSKCIMTLKVWLSWGYVIDWDDVSNLGRKMNPYTGCWVMNTEKGKRDLVAWFKVGKVLWTYFIECKEPDGGFWSEDQQRYAKKFEGLSNVIYEVVSNPNQIDITLNRLTGRTEKILEECDKIMMPQKGIRLKVKRRRE